MSNDPAILRGLLYASTLSSTGLTQLCLWLLQRSAGEPGFADAFDEFRQKLILSLKNPDTVGFSIEDEANAASAALSGIEEALARWSGQLRQAEDNRSHGG